MTLAGWKKAFPNANWDNPEIDPETGTKVIHLNPKTKDGKKKSIKEIRAIQGLEQVTPKTKE